MYAVANGTVIDSNYYSASWGNIILIKHDLPDGSNIWSQYAHLRDRFVTGGTVNKGDPIGTIGKGANDKYYAHLHFEIRIKYLSASAWPSGWTDDRVREYYVNPTDFINGHRQIGGGTDRTPPDGDITSPSEGAEIRQRSVHLVAWASDGGSGVNRAHFTGVWSGASWQQIGGDFTSSADFMWDMCDAAVPDGPVTLGLDIWDNAGNPAHSPHGTRHFTKRFDCSPPPPSCEPNANQVALYSDTNYRGNNCKTLDIGEYPNPSHLNPVGNDNTRSVKIGGNVQAVLCKDDNYQGGCDTFTNSDSNLLDNGIGSQTSSIKVQWRSSGS
jgi:hypothetical protein